MPHVHADLCRSTADALERLPSTTAPEVLVGFDGFIDHIIDVVATRESRTSYAAMPTIAVLGQRVSAAAGKSANFELVTKKSKIGGNGPIMANALCAQAAAVTAVGILGEQVIDPVFAPLVERARKVITLGAPAVTDALEFSDGKLMLGKLFPLERVTFDALVKSFGGLDGLKQAFRAPAGIATVNWTMTLEMTAIWERLSAEVLPGLRTDRPKWFIDLADPAKRTQSDIKQALAALQGLQRHADVVLGLNEAECRQILDIIGKPWPTAATDYQAAELGCAAIRQHLGLSYVMCHLVRASAVAWQGGSTSADGFFVDKPLITTGAGDHFNAGFFLALLAGLQPGQCLQTGGGTSGHYVRTAQSPTRAQVAAFLRSAAA